MVEKSKIIIEDMGLAAAVNACGRFNSASRAQMTYSQYTQAVTMEIMESPNISNCLESQMADYTFSDKIPENCRVISVHKKFPRGFIGVPESDQETTIIFATESGEVDCLVVKEADTRHLEFGSIRKLNPRLKSIKPGDYIEGETRMATSPTVMHDGTWATGINLNFCCLSLYGAIEDGFIFRKSKAEQCAPLRMGSKRGSCGKQRYMLNTYGTADNFKGFPDVGDKIRDDGLIMAFRSYDDNFDVINLTNEELMKIDTASDERIYGMAGATVYDVNVWANDIEKSQNKMRTPVGTDLQMHRYLQVFDRFYDSILRSYENNIKRERLHMTPKLSSLIRTALGHRPNKTKRDLKAKGFRFTGTDAPIGKRRKMETLDEYEVEIKYHRRDVLNTVAKMTDPNGSKGILCEIRDDADMPDGVDVIQLGKAVVSRLNLGQLYQQFMGAAGRDVRLEMLRMSDNGDSLLDIFDYLRSFYMSISRQLCGRIDLAFNDDRRKSKHVNWIMDNCIKLHIQADDLDIGPDMIERVHEVVEPTFEPIEYINYNGKRVRTKNKVFIGDKYFILLDKTAAVAKAVSCSLLQTHGLIVGSTSRNKYANASVIQATRVYGETEVRNYIASMGGGVMAKIMRLNNSPSANRCVAETIMDAPNPIRIGVVLENVVEKHRSRPSSLAMNVMNSGGLEIRESTRRILH